MKVLLINGSPNEHGCTYTALAEVADTLHKYDIATEIVYLGRKPIVLGSPVYYSNPTGQILSFVQRLFFCKEGVMAGKLGASVVSCRRGGASAAFESLNQFFTICNMPVVSSQYWNSVHGFTPEDVHKDKEGLQTMRSLGENMAWMLKALAGNPHPAYEQRQRTHFIQDKY